MKQTRLYLALAMTFPATLMAAGYNVGTQSTSNQGVANAGAAAVFDASTIFSNPAGLTRLKGSRFSIIGTYVIPSVKYTDTGSTINVPSTPINIPLQGNNGGTPVENTLVPHFYYSNQLNDSLTFGVGAFVPFGSKTEYDENWIGRYNIVGTELKTLAINPSVGWKINDSFSVGAGVSTQWMKGKLTRKINFGAGALKVVPLLPGAAQAAAQTALIDMYGNSAYDGNVEIDGTDWSYGFNLGAMWNITDKSRLGVAYRSSIKHKLSGGADWTTSDIATGITSRLTPVVGAGTAAAIGAAAQSSMNASYVDSGATVDVTTPESLSINLFTELNDKWSWMSDVTWTRHSRFKELRVDFASSLPDSITVENWKNTFRFSEGVTYKATDNLLLKAGFALDNSTEDETTRTPSLPDSMRTWYSVGASYALSRQSVLDFAFTYIHLKASTINSVDDGGGELPCGCSYATLRGNYSVHSYLAGLQYNYSF